MQSMFVCFLKLRVVKVANPGLGNIVDIYHVIIYWPDRQYKEVIKANDNTDIAFFLYEKYHVTTDFMVFILIMTLSM